MAASTGTLRVPGWKRGEALVDAGSNGEQWYRLGIGLEVLFQEFGFKGTGRRPQEPGGFASDYREGAGELAGINNGLPTVTNSLDQCQLRNLSLALENDVDRC